MMVYDKITLFINLFFYELFFVVCKQTEKTAFAKYKVAELNRWLCKNTKNAPSEIKHAKYKI